MVSIANDDHCQQAFTLASYNFDDSQHTALINLVTEANRARRLAESTADRGRQLFEEEHTFQSVHISGT